MLTKNNENKVLNNNHICTLLLITIAIPLSMSLWIINLIYSKLMNNTESLDGKYNQIKTIIKC